MERRRLASERVLCMGFHGIMRYTQQHMGATSSASAILGLALEMLLFGFKPRPPIICSCLRLKLRFHHTPSKVSLSLYGYVTIATSNLPFLAYRCPCKRTLLRNAKQTLCHLWDQQRLTRSPKKPIRLIIDMAVARALWLVRTAN